MHSRSVSVDSGSSLAAIHDSISWRRCATQANRDAWV
jgi:hypothetical protein